MQYGNNAAVFTIFLPKKLWFWATQNFNAGESNIAGNWPLAALSYSGGAELVGPTKFSLQNITYRWKISPITTRPTSKIVLATIYDA